MLFYEGCPQDGCVGRRQKGRDRENRTALEGPDSDFLSPLPIPSHGMAPRKDEEIRSVGHRYDLVPQGLPVVSALRPQHQKLGMLKDLSLAVSHDHERGIFRVTVPVQFESPFDNTSRG